MAGYRCLRSWSPDQCLVSHPEGKASDAWGYAEGRAFMQTVVERILSDTADRDFTVKYDQLPRRGPFNILREFTMKTSRGIVTIEALDVSYEAVFGMLSVFPGLATDPPVTAHRDRLPPSVPVGGNATHT